MRYLSVCSGIEAASVAWEPLGWEAAAFSEIEAFPRAVLKHRFPDVPVHGDFTTINGDEYGAVDLLVGGTPCQSFSVAGLRKGLADDRGNLALEYILLADRLRPRWMVWENVPGVLSSCRDRSEFPDAVPGEDFAAFLSAAARWDVGVPAGGWQNHGIVQAAPVDGAYGLAWGTLDAQHFGTPQRRRRVFVVGYLGDWRRAAAVLFERSSLAGDPPPSRSPRPRSAGDPGERLAFGGNNTRGPIEVFTALTAHAVPHGRCDFESETFITVNARQDPIHSAEDFGAVDTDGYSQAVAFALRGRVDGAVPELHGDGDSVGALRSASGGSSRDYVAFQSATEFLPQSSQVYSETETAPTLQATGKRNGNRAPMVAFAENSRGELRLEGGDGSLTGADSAGGGKPGQGFPAIAGPTAVRRLTPVECERLQGFPDNWTDIPWKGKPHAPDGPRYGAIGNSMSTKVMAWLGRQIAAVDAIPVEGAPS